MKTSGQGKPCPTSNFEGAKNMAKVIERATENEGQEGCDIHGTSQLTCEWVDGVSQGWVCGLCPCSVDFEIKAVGKNSAGVDVIGGKDEDIMTEMVEKYGFAGVLLNLQSQLDTEQIQAEDHEDNHTRVVFRKLKNNVRVLILKFNEVFVP
jgi:hypothetical protein